MPAYLIALIILCALVAAFCTFMVCFAVYAQNKGFGGRFEKNRLLKYFTAEEFSLNTEAVETRLGKTKLKGFIYWSGDISSVERLVIFSHGMGPGQCSYTTEIAYFCRNGCAVLAFDCCGCGLSGGKSLGGLENSARVLVAAAKYAKGRRELKNLKTYFVGHSMGAYSALVAASFAHADGVVSFSSPDQPSRMVECGAAPLTGKFFAKILRPFVKVVTFFRFGKYADIKASRAIVRSGVPALVIHGDCDTAVPLELSAYNNLSEVGNIKLMLCRGKGHNPYNTISAERRLYELKQGIMTADKMSEREKQAFFSAQDYYAICEEDAEVMSAVYDFIFAD